MQAQTVEARMVDVACSKDDDVYTSSGIEPANKIAVVQSPIVQEACESEIALARSTSFMSPA
jgi:hypothetical protein